VEWLFDDAALDRSAGVRRTLAMPRKEPVPVLRPERPWEQAGLVGTLSPFYDRTRRLFRLWYRARMPGAPRRTFLCYAESPDAVHWTRPALGLSDFTGFAGNNIVREIGEADSVFWNIVFDADDPDPARRYKALGFDHTPEGNGICVAYSPDGFRWPTPPRQALPTSQVTDADCLFPRRDPLSGKWVGFFRPRTAPKRRFLGLSESDDFDHWTRPRMLLTPDAQDEEWTEFYGLAAACLGEWRVGAMWVYRNHPDYSPMTTELVYSREGRAYHRAFPRRKFVPLGPAGAFDCRMIMPVALVEHGPEFLIFYSGWNREHGSDRGMPMQNKEAALCEPLKTGIGLARVNKHHLCGLQAEGSGVIESRWLCNYGESGVLLAADIAPSGTILVELLDQYGKVLPGWSGRESRLAPCGDGRFRCLWSGDRSAQPGRASPEGGTIGHVLKLRLCIHKATLCGFQAGDAPGAGPA